MAGWDLIYFVAASEKPRWSGKLLALKSATRIAPPVTCPIGTLQEAGLILRRGEGCPG